MTSSEDFSKALELNPYSPEFKAIKDKMSFEEEQKLWQKYYGYQEEIPAEIPKEMKYAGLSKLGCHLFVWADDVINLDDRKYMGDEAYPPAEGMVGHSRQQDHEHLFTDAPLEAVFCTKADSVPNVEFILNKKKSEQEEVDAAIAKKEWEQKQGSIREAGNKFVESLRSTDPTTTLVITGLQDDSRNYYNHTIIAGVLNRFVTCKAAFQPEYEQDNSSLVDAVLAEVGTIEEAKLCVERTKEEWATIKRAPEDSDEWFGVLSKAATCLSTGARVGYFQQGAPADSEQMWYLKLKDAVEEKARAPKSPEPTFNYASNTETKDSNTEESSKESSCCIIA